MAIKPLRVAVCYHGVLDVGGVESHLVGLMGGMGQDEVEWCVLSRCSPTFEARLPKGVQVVDWPLADTWLQKIKQLKSLIERHQIDVIHFHSPDASIPGRVAAKLAGIPAIVTVHLRTWDYYQGYGSIRAQLGRRVYTGIDRILNWLATDRIICVSRKALGDRSSGGRARVFRKQVLIPNGISILEKEITPEMRLMIRQEWDIDPGARVDLFVGRLDRQKRADIFMRALAQLSLPVFGVIVGGGRLERGLRAMAEDLGISQRVRFLGQRLDVGNILATADVFVLPSEFEGMSMALLEAMAAGLVCVVSNASDPDGLIVDNVSGIRVGGDRIEDWVGGIERATFEGEPNLALGKNAREVVKEFDFMEMAEKTYQVYREVNG